MADDDIAALLEDAALVMNSDDEDDADDGSFMSPGFVLREIDELKSPTELVNSHHSSSSAKMTPTTFLDRMLNEAELKDGLEAPDLDGPSAIVEEDGEMDDSEDEEDAIEGEEDGDADSTEDAKMEEDLVDIEALMLNQSLTDKSHTSNASKDAFELLMSQSVSDILKEQAAVPTVAPKAPSPPATPKHNPSNDVLHDQKSPVDRALSGLFKSLGGVFLNQSFHRGNHAPIDEEAESDIEAEKDTPVGKAPQDDDASKADSKSGVESAASFSGQRAISRESSDDAMSFVTATEQTLEPTPRSLYMPPLETVESMDQATPKRGNEKVKPPSLGTEVIVNERTKEEDEQQVSPMATLPINQVEQVFRTNEVLVHPQQDLVSLSSASSTVSQVSKAEASSRWIKHSAAMAQTFNPSRSIFANKNTYDSLNISPPGSPPEPVYSWANDEEENAPVLTFPEAINWEMLGYQADDIATEASSVGASDHGSRFSGKHRLSSPERVANTMSDMRRAKSPEKKGSNVSSPSRARNPSLEEKLATVLALQPIGLPFRYAKPKHLEYAGLMLWHQLLACWKHTEMARALTTQHPSRHFVRDDNATPATRDDGDLSSGSSRIQKPAIENLRLHGTQFCPQLRPETKNLDGFFPGDGVAMTRFLGSLPSRGGKIYHEVDDLLEYAEQTTSEFAELMEAVVAFARFDSAEVSFEINVKNAEAITRKARQKYSGDVRQVKDVLRSRINFPTESSLICGLVKLFNMQGDSFKCVRVKNLFQRDGNDSLIESTLPTRYRHILLNIRWKSGFLSEIQLNLARMYAVMEAEGYQLHQNLTDLQEAMSGFPLFLTQLISDISCRLCRPDSESFLATVSLSPCHEKARLQETKGDVTVDVKQFKAPNLDESSTNAEEEDAREDSQRENRSYLYLEDLRKAELNNGNLFLSIIETAALETTRRPRDFPTHCCCYFMLRALLHNANDEDNFQSLGFDVKNRKDLAEYTILCLRRALKISNQAISVGMYGWIEYGTRSPLARLLGQPFDLLRLLSYDYARLGDWQKSEETLRARLSRCEQQLPRYHPTTLVCMVDLAVASRKNGRRRFASRLLSQAAVRLSDYLKEMEKDFLTSLSRSTKLGGKPGDTVIRIEHGRDALTMLQFFVSIMRLEMKREMVDIATASDEAILTNYCFFGEALCIYANCKSASRTLAGCRKSLRAARDPLWKEAADQFSLSLHGLLLKQGISSMSVTRAAFGVARCLRELNECDKALEMLSIIAARHPDSNENYLSTEESASTMPEPPTKQFLRVKKHKPSLLIKKILSSLCLWLMAALALDRSPDEEGRGLAFRYLHAASVNLQTALKGADEDDPLRSSYIQFLSMIEDEALQIAEPIYE